MPHHGGNVYIHICLCKLSIYLEEDSDKCGYLQGKVVGSRGEREFVLSCEPFHIL